MTLELSKDAEVQEIIGALEPFLTARTCRAGQVLWTEGERSGRLVVLDEGRVKILRARPDGEQVLLYVFGPGELFGFLPFVDGGPYPATAVALDEVRARVMSRSALREALARDPQLALGLLQSSASGCAAHSRASMRWGGGLHRADQLRPWSRCYQPILGLPRASCMSPSQPMSLRLRSG